MQRSRRAYFVRADDKIAAAIVLHVARARHGEDGEQDRVAGLLDEGGVEGDQGLVQAQHDEGA